MSIKKRSVIVIITYFAILYRYEELGENPKGICHSGSTANSQSMEEDSHSN